MLTLSYARVYFAKLFSTSAVLSVRKFDVKVDGNTTVVQVIKVPEKKNEKVLKHSPDKCSFCDCNMPVKLKYSDVLILEQFMREDGTVLPMQLTGLCKRQQLKVERCVMQAHWAGLFPNKTVSDFDRAGYKRFWRYWDDDMDMYKLKQKTEIGSWHYIKRYKSRLGVRGDC